MNLQETIKKILLEETETGLNIDGGKLKACSTKPITGYYRDGYCRTGKNDTGSHTVCARVTEEFLTFTKSKGNNYDNTLRTKPDRAPAYWEPPHGPRRVVLRPLAGR